jgi:uncharacterized protein (TIGR03067 family)
MMVVRPPRSEFLMLVSTLILSLSVSAPGPKDAAPAPVTGLWVVAKGVVGGTEVPLPGGAITFDFGTDGTLVVRADGADSPEGSGTYTLDPKKSPAEIDMVPADPKLATAKGIYKVDGDALTLCFIKGAKDVLRPAKFASPAGSEVALFTLKRAKK